MKKILFLFFLISISFPKIKAQETITISGRVTDFDGTPIDSSIVRLIAPDFTDIAVTYSDKDGYYKLENMEKGKYMSLFAMRPKEYPRSNTVPEEDMRLEFWAWNIIADRDLTINPRYHKLELYGTTAYRVFGGYNGFFIYTRPMSVTKYISYEKEIYLDKTKAEKETDISVKPEHFKVKVYADDEPLKVNSVQMTQEFVGKDNSPMTGYLIQVDAPKKKTDKPYIIFRVEAENTEDDEKGENIYFYELPDFKRAAN